MTLKQLLVDLRACEAARIWAEDKTIEETVDKCERADWLLWLAKKVECDRRKLVLCGGLCANTVRHIMKDDRSIMAIDVAIAYGEGRATDDELDAAKAAAMAEAWPTAWAKAKAAATHATCAAAWDAAWNAALKDMADIIRPVIKDELVEKVNELCNASA